MYSLDEFYGEQFFSTNQWEGLRHAEWFMPLLMKVFKFKSVIDVGCGTGHFLKWCIEHEIYNVWGLEGSSAGVDSALGPIWRHDLREALNFDGRQVEARKWDIAISVEVAEHIEAEYADNFVKILTDASDTIVMTAAPPGQGGLQHVNEQPKDYWIDLFSKRDFSFDADTTADLVGGILAAEGRGEHVAKWFLPNIMVFRKASA